MKEHFNKLSPSEAERLAILAEECAEVIQMVGKILRHGYESHHPLGHTPNRELLEIEIGHVMSITSMMIKAKDLNEERIDRMKCAKLEKIKPYLHHQ